MQLNLMTVVQARLPDGSISRDPVFMDANSTQYHGTAILNPQTATNLPVLQMCVYELGPAALVMKLPAHRSQAALKPSHSPSHHHALQVLAESGVAGDTTGREMLSLVQQSLL